jgi:hypothetical protein
VTASGAPTSKPTAASGRRWHRVPSKRVAIEPGSGPLEAPDEPLVEVEGSNGAAGREKLSAASRSLAPQSHRVPIRGTVVDAHRQLRFDGENAAAHRNPFGTETA